MQYYFCKIKYDEGRNKVKKCTSYTYHILKGKILTIFVLSILFIKEKSLDVLRPKVKIEWETSILKYVKKLTSRAKYKIIFFAIIITVFVLSYRPRTLYSLRRALHGRMKLK